MAEHVTLLGPEHILPKSLLPLFEDDLASLLKDSAERMLLLLIGCEGVGISLQGDALVYRGVAGCLAQHLGAEVHDDLSSQAMQSAKVLLGQNQLVSLQARQPEGHSRREKLSERTERFNIVVAPLRMGGQCVGLIHLLFKPTHTFSDLFAARFMVLADSLVNTIQLHRTSQRLQLSQAQYQQLFLNSPLPMYVLSHATRQVVAVNQSTRRLYGYSDAEFLQMHASDFLWEQDPTERQKMMEHTRNARMVEGLRRTHRTKSGRAVEVEIWMNLVDFEGEMSRLVLVADVTQRVETERQLAKVSRAQKMLSAVAQALPRAANEAELLHRACEIVVQLGHYRLAFIGMAQQDAGKNVVTVAHAGQAQQLLAYLNPSWDEQSPRGLGPSGRVIRSGHAVVIEDIAAAVPSLPQADRALAAGFKSCISLPLRDGGQTFGALNLCSLQVAQVSAEELKLLEELADNLAFGVVNLRNLARQQSAEQAQQRIQIAVMKVAAAISASGTAFFEQLALNMADALRAQCGFVFRLLPPEDGAATALRSLGAVVHGTQQVPFGWVLGSSKTTAPGSTSDLAALLGRHESCIEAPAIQAFANVPVLAQLSTHFHVVRRIDNQDGAPIGLMLLGYDQKPEHAELVCSMLQIFASRAATELTQQAAGARIRDLARLLDHAQDAITVCDMKGRVLYWNKGSERLFGWTADEALHQSARLLLGASRPQRDAPMEALRAVGEWHGEDTKRCKDGRFVTVESRWTLVDGENGQEQTVLVIDTDITERKMAELKIQTLAFYDALTGLPNRVLLQERLQAAVERVQGTEALGGAVLLIDLDNFKTINETLGHDKGDLLLQEVGSRLCACVSKTDTVARLGGDEFVVLLEALGVGTVEVAARARLVGERIIRELSVPYRLAGFDYHGRSSIGIAPFLSHANDAGELLKQADIAMYQAKSAGRHTLRFFDVGLQSVVSERADLEVALRQAFVEDEFLLHYQPQVDHAGQLLGVEALVRWNSPQRGLVSPAVFIPLCEEVGLIFELGHRVLEMACSVLAEWRHNPSTRALTMAVNVSPRQFRHPEFVKQVKDVLRASGAAPDQLKLELTESVLVDDMDSVISKMEALKSIGVSFSLDDFGTGYSSLVYLKRLPLDQLKIDQSFVRDVLSDSNDAAIASTVIALGHSLGLGVIAEGVENIEQRDFLEEKGCQAYQGYLFSRPLAQSALNEFLAQRALEANNAVGAVSSGKA
ncbi:sensor domain-containing protein [Variovorax sp. HJSM1_2]|uniref:sensor domain-containing protein n=1 Tax=Variovorax sp. HJSM1_2 TaxID=3366263 RepID=UPI003BC1F4A5